MFLSFGSNDRVQSEENGGNRVGEYSWRANRLTMASVLRQRFGAFRRTLLPTVSQHPVHSPSMIAKRFMGGHGGDDAEETFKWRNVTIACVIGLIPMMFNTFSGDEEHHHGDERPAYSYLHIRNKEFPWGPNGLFESDD